jgi:scyllo-inositol 2-dehydrogenase (NADP+)
MRYLLVGLGNLGAKRRAVLGERCVATVDPFNAEADFRQPEECPADHYDAAILAMPNDVKIRLMEFFRSRGKHVPGGEATDPRRRECRTAGPRRTRGRAIWYTSYNFRFEPNVLALKRHLEAGTIGRLYRARMFYGNGTAGKIAGTWRDSPLGILEDMASHLIDLAGFVFGRFGSEFHVWERRGSELKGFDHCLLPTADRAVTIECSFLSWRNRSRIEALGEEGALEMNGLTKWGKSELAIVRRRRPGGIPDERREVAHGPDPTWAADIRHFEEMAATGTTSCENDLWLSRTVQAAAVARLEGGS